MKKMIIAIMIAAGLFTTSFTNAQQTTGNTKARQMKTEKIKKKPTKMKTTTVANNKGIQETQKTK